MELHPQLVNKVVDTLDLRISRDAQPSDWLLTQVRRWRKAIEEWEPGTEPLLVEFPELGTFKLLGSQKPYEFKLAHPDLCDIRIWKPESWDKAVSGKTGQIFIGFRSKFLQLAGLEAVKEVVCTVSALLLDDSRVLDLQHPRPAFVRVARGDLAVDVWQDRGLKLRDLEHMVCQSRKTDVFTTLSDLHRTALLERVQNGAEGDTPPLSNKGVSIRMREPGPAEAAAASVLDAFRESVADELAEGKRGGKVSRLVMDGRQPQTVYFGRYTSSIFCKVYNKLASLPMQHKLYMLDEWISNGWDGQGNVWRWEWTFTGEFLKSIYVGNDRCDIRDLDTLLEFIPALWHYVTRKWLRQIRNGDARGNTDKEPITLYWALIQSAWDGGVGVTRDHSRILRVKDEDDRIRKIRELEAQARGCLTTATALKKSSRQDSDVQTRIMQLEKQARGCLTSAEALKVANVQVMHESGLRFDPDTGEVFDVANLVLDSVHAWIGDDIDTDVWHRRREIGVDDLSDSAITSLFRQYRMAEGWGS